MIYIEPLTLEASQFEHDVVSSNYVLSRMDTFNGMLETTLRLPSEGNDPPIFDNADCWVLARYCNRVHQLCRTVLRSGRCELGRRWLGEAVLKQLERLRRNLRHYRLVYYHRLLTYAGMGVGRTWNLPVHVFMAECWLWLVRRQCIHVLVRAGLLAADFRDKHNPTPGVADVAQLRDTDMVLMYPELFNTQHPSRSASLTQYQFNLSMKLLARRWHYTHLSLSLERYVETLFVQAAELMLLHVPERLDGARKRDWCVGVEGKNRTCSAEFVANLAVQFTYMERDFLMCRMLIERIDPLTNNLVPPSQERNVIRLQRWNQLLRTIPLDVRQRLIAWLRPQLDSIARAGGIGKMRDSIVTMMLRLGESEHYTRQNAGIMQSEFMLIAENSRSAVQVSWWTQTAFSSLGDYMQTTDANALNTKDRLRDLLLFQIFHQMMVTNFNVSWWDYIVVHEYDIMECYDTKLLRALNPLIIMCGGRFVIYYVYRIDRPPYARTFQHADEALAAWMQCMAIHKYDRINGMTFDTVQDGTYNVTELYGDYCKIFNRLP